MLIFTDYLPIFLMFVVAAGFSVANIILSALFGPSHPTPAKLAPYECGADPIGDARTPFAPSFYRVAMLFLLFDVEIALMLPVLVVFKDYSPKWVAFAELFLFMGFLVVGYVYVRGRGSLKWD